MLLLQIVFMWGYSLSPDARSEGRILAQRILAVYPHARIYSYHPLGKDPPLEMPIYLNRAITRVDSPSGITPAGQEPQVILVAVRQTLPVPPPNS